MLQQNLAEQVAQVLNALPPNTGARQIIAIAAAPGAGKSTLAEAVVAALVARGTAAALVPMDGFHLDNKILEARGLLARKGAPQTFDAHGFAALIARLKHEDEVFVPVFDRPRDLAIAGAARIGGEHGVVVVEGNYLLLNQAPWSRLAAFWDLSVWINVPLAVLEARLIQRWLDHGLSQADAEARARGNDLANAALVIEHRTPADLTLGI
jgi:fructokinase